MNVRFPILVIATLVTLIGAADLAADLPRSRHLLDKWQSSGYERSKTLLSNRSLDEEQAEAAFQARSLAIREKLAALDLDKLDVWWRRRNIGDPHKYLLPVILARLNLGDRYDRQHSWDMLLNMDKDKPDLYHFRSPYDVRIFFMFRDAMPTDVEASYRKMVEAPRILEWMEQGTENHMFMQRSSGLALMDGSGWPNNRPATAATNEAWLRAEVNKFLTIGQGEFHSSTYYAYSIIGLLNLYDFARTPELRQLAKAALDWYAVNMALRLSWGTAGGAESRGFDRGTWGGSELAAVAWLWWGDDPEVAQRMEAKYAWVALPPALSNYRPPPQLRAIARKEVALPFQLKASHPSYYSYHQDNQFWETFYVTEDYSLGTLLDRQRSYQTQGTINAQYATYKLVIRDPKGVNNGVVSLGGTFHSPMAKGRSPGDQYLQERGAVIYQLRLNERDKAAGVPARSHLVLPARYGEPQRYKDWYIWQVESAWLCARPWGETINWQAQVSQENRDYQALAAMGSSTAWVTDVAAVKDYPDFRSLQKGLDRTQIDDRAWDKSGRLTYISLAGDRLEMTYEPDGGIGRARINDKERVLKDWSVLDSPYVKEELNSGILEVISPEGKWRLQATVTGPKWEMEGK
ncbi:MAG TPA: hypothetical protein DC064_01845 [Cyanobacteria bacterium UBA9273]|nr:hypothetical protein [Cyanobacteria bacterium UBA9273]